MLSCSCRGVYGISLIRYSSCTKITSAKCSSKHLGDERPCQRCVKRGLQDACHDGVRKKAKYLSDMPNEVLGSGIVGHYPPTTGHALPSGAFAGLPQAVPGSMGQNMYSQMQQQQRHNAPHQQFYQRQQQQQQQSSYGPYRQSYPVGQTPRMTDNQIGGFISPTNSATPPFVTSPTGKATPLANVMTSNAQDQGLLSSGEQLNPAIYDINDPLFNMDLTSLNFVNQYGALELGMLGHMSSGISEQSAQDLKMMSSPSVGDFPGTAAVPNTSLYNDASNQTGMLYDGSLKPSTSWQPDPYIGQGIAGQASSDEANMMTPVADELSFPLGYTISAGPDEVMELISALEGDDNAMAGGPLASSSHAAKQQQQEQQQQQQQQQQQMPTSQPVVSAQQRSVAQEQTEISDARLNATLSTFHAQTTASRKRRLDASSVYETVKQPYNYINGFHSLINFLQENFSHEKTSRIARALASIRPSFIACTQHLNKLDLVYMEKCFQRTLCEYEDFINRNGTPTVICRRTGEVAAVSREFTCLTGWRKEVLLGKEPNLNVHLGSGRANTGAGAGKFDADGKSGSRGGSGSSGGDHDQSANAAAGSESDAKQTEGMKKTTTTTQQPVFLAELLDEDSVIRFYEDFAHVAFSDSRGSITAACKLLRYRTKKDIARSGGSADVESAQAAKESASTAATASGTTTFKEKRIDDSQREGSDTTPDVKNNVASRSSRPLHSNNKNSNKNNDGSAGSASSSSSAVNEVGIMNSNNSSNSSRSNSNSNSNRSSLSSSPASASQARPTPGPGNLIRGESGLQFLGDDKGRVDCMLCWTVKRDMFEVPMLIVMNVSFFFFFFLNFLTTAGLFLFLILFFFFLEELIKKYVLMEITSFCHVYNLKCTCSWR